MRPSVWLLPVFFLSLLAAQDPPRTAEDQAREDPSLKSIEDYAKKRIIETPSVTVRPEPPSLSYARDTRPCSIPLLSIIPRVTGGSMPVLPGPPDAGPIRIIEPPAPPCEEKATLQRAPVDIRAPDSVVVTPDVVTPDLAPPDQAKP